MTLDYTQGCVNFRDVGEWVGLIAGKEHLPTQRILRGGKLDFVQSAVEIGDPATIINLRRGPDPVEKAFGAVRHHIFLPRGVEHYDTSRSEVREWLNKVIKVLEDAAFPVLFHCTSGKDRTGVVVAAVLGLLEVPRWVIHEEYLLSDGEKKPSCIEVALDSISPAYLHRVNVEQVRLNVLGPKTMPG